MLSNIQQELLKLYSTNIPDKQLVDIRLMLSDYFAKEVDNELNQVWKERKWSDKTIQDWKEKHLRTPYNKP